LNDIYTFFEKTAVRRISILYVTVKLKKEWALLYIRGCYKEKIFI